MSENKKIISIDAMGGDKAPNAVMGGMNQFLFQNGEGDVYFHVFGDEDRLRKLLSKYPRVLRNCKVFHTPAVIKGTDKIRDVIRSAQNTSMYMAIKDVRDGNAVAVVSAGNTGILMALSKLALKTIDGISRPAITTMLPSGGGDQRVAILDLGANVRCDEENLFDFALLGSVYAEIVGKMKYPKVGILNIGEEDTKGNETLRRLNKLLTERKDELPYDYIGFVEGNDIGGGNVQVVVTDGFTGNIVLKTVEGTAKLIKRVIMENLKKSILAIIGAFFLVHVFKRLKHKIDPRSYAGAVFLGLNGFAVKTHGNSDALAFANAIKYAADLSESDFYNQIKETVDKLAPIKKIIRNKFGAVLAPLGGETPPLRGNQTNIKIISCQLSLCF
ncbi:MAG: phosphate acyltransferase PlsX [Rickettsiales bacterium]|jgi:glycerol-3-phosphate acyltransferase PlsX|nr:phosphate acyltransferase PlsX [Rickettsiales bacterium]